MTEIKPDKKKYNRTFTIATINCRNLASDETLQDYVDRFAKKKIDIIALQGVHRRTSESRFVESKDKNEVSEVYWVGTGPKNICSGTGFAFRKSTYLEIIEPPKNVFASVMYATVRIMGVLIKIVNGYAPPTEGKKSEKVSFYRNIKTAIYAAPANATKQSLKKRSLVVLGDFNAEISAASYKSDLSYINADALRALPAGPDMTSENGGLFLNLIKDYQLVNLNTAYQHKKVRRATKISPDPSQPNQIIDYINVSHWLGRLATNCRVYNSIVTDESKLSDHRVLLATFRIPEGGLAKIKNKPKPQIPRSDPVVKSNKKGSNKLIL